jgi:cyclic beta-1,2-glucan synthetase
VLSGVGEPDRARQAMGSVDEFLVRRLDRLIRLFTPPFDHGKLHPGYIKGYVPGIRENGGQYTHAATWVIRAVAELGQGGRAMELFDLINPVNLTANAEGVKRYRTEPYALAGDVYGEPPNTGRGGWTWYTGSASWLYRTGLESILGFQPQGTSLHLNPCIPAHWSGFELVYTYRSTTYRIKVANPDKVEHGVQQVTLDGQTLADGVVQLVDDGKEHVVEVALGRIQHRV